MDFFQIGDTLDYSKYNGLTYLLRKYRRLRTNITLGEKNIVDKYGTYRFMGDFTNINGNYILEEPVNIYADDVFKNAVYTFVFNVVNIDTSEQILRRIVYKEGDTGDDGVLNITLPDDMLGENEVILPSVTVDIYFSTHESQNRLNSFKVSLDVEETYLTSGTNTITLTILEPDDTPVDNVLTTIYINNTPHQVETDENGEATYTYTYTGTEGKVIVRSNGAEAVFFDGGIDFDYNELYTTGLGYYWNLQLGYNSKGESWLPSNGGVTLSCPITSQQWSLNNPKTQQTFTSTKASASPITEVSYKLLGDMTAIGADMFNSCYGLNSITLPRGIERIGKRAFIYTTGLESIVIPDTVYSLGDSCFYGSGLEEITLPRSINSIGAYAFDRCKIETYKLKWIENEIIPYTANRFPVIDETVFIIPYGETANYVAKNYPADRLEEDVIVPDTITVTGTPIIQTGNTNTITATLLDGSIPVSGETLSYEIKKGSTVIDSGSDTTDDNGEIEIEYISTGAGNIDVIVSYDEELTETYAFEDCYAYDLGTYSSNHTYNISLPETFKIEFDLLITQTSNNSCMIRIGESESKALICGKVGSGDSIYKILARKSSDGTGDITTTGESIVVSNDWQSNTITFDGTTFTYRDMSITDFNTISLDKLVSFSTWKSGTTSGQIKNVKIKAL